MKRVIALVLVGALTFGAGFGLLRYIDDDGVEPRSLTQAEFIQATGDLQAKLDKATFTLEGHIEHDPLEYDRPSWCDDEPEATPDDGTLTLRFACPDPILLRREVIYRGFPDKLRVDFTRTSQSDDDVIRDHMLITLVSPKFSGTCRAPYCDPSDTYGVPEHVRSVSGFSGTTHAREPGEFELFEPRDISVRHRIMLGERATCYSFTSGNADPPYTAEHCFASDGIPLYARDAAWGSSGSTWQAVSVERSVDQRVFEQPYPNFDPEQLADLIDNLNELLEENN